MLRSLFVISYRKFFRKDKLFTSINIIGLSVGIACLLLVTLFIQEEYAYDRYHAHADRTYRLVVDFANEGNITHWARSSAAIGHFLQGYYPEIEQVLRIRKNPGTDLLTYKENSFYEQRIFFADSSLFDVFDFKLKLGDESKALQDNNSIVITEKLARKLFRDKEAMGESIRFNNQVDLKISGILEEIPGHSHFVADAFITFSTLYGLFGERRLMHWGQFDHYTYVLLAPSASSKVLEEKFPDFIKTFAPAWVAEKEKFFLQELTSIHLHSHRKDELGTNSNENYALILGTIALFIVIMAVANFINLSTASQATRLKEVNIRKMLGAGKNNLLIYFMIESWLVSFFALVVAVLLNWLVLPYFNQLTDRQIVFHWNLRLTLLCLVVIFTITILGGLFSAWQSYRVKYTLLNKLSIGGKGGGRLRKVLITFQFFISILLIAATWIVTKQLSYLESSQIGFDGNRVIVVPIKDRSGNNRYNTLVNELQQISGVEKVSFGSSTPGSNNSFTYTYTFSGSELGEQTLSSFIVDEHFFDLYGIQLREGRIFNPDYTDTLTEIILNEAAVRYFNLKEPIGQRITGKVKGRVVGVVNNFNHTSLHDEFSPVIIYPYTPTFRFVSIKLKEGNEVVALAELEKNWDKFFPGFPMEYVFLNDQIKQLYSAEKLLRKAYQYFAVIALIIAGIGLIGLSGFMMERKRKEISIRKVFGGSVEQIITRIYIDFIGVVIIATLIAWVIIYFWSQRWLSGFAYKITLSPMYFVWPVMIMVFVLLLSTGLQTLMAARTNPADNLREE
ncbi:MAG: ABC transporter permease [Cyclobacteriaceae bacterium]|nr:ABC transporter permease [Cyclobacteriaceae bacterium]UYN85998.1 MAG: ABC transporter permease [Cyclobacteriaceae bacterium]